MTARPQYVIEHLEDLDVDSPSTFPQWALLEYTHMLELVGSGSTVHFTSLSPRNIDSLRTLLTSSSSSSSAGRANFELHTQGILSLIESVNVPLEQVCLLDPKGPLPVSSNDAPRETAAQDGTTTAKQEGFRFFLFGGILGDDPPRDRTAILRQMGFPGRHLGPVQMTTDTAVGVTKRVVEDGMLMGLDDEPQRQGAQKIKWVQYPELKFGRGESVEMPFRYMVDPVRSEKSGTDEPLMPEGMRELIKRDLDRSFEF
ncbi:uncharacterized protein PFL1_04867 [Pseudozyma flocculosa PF-1]|uniref:Related to DUF431 domain protein n=2 Tax=Pseudozyma flocculosa TaxID=84751 RepID=A0A5C3F799_9BASI|nr:uncharacterized protein PFL1_04867 [Pseudozyma flocculosa PF-1]EPQ27730.1 hypothetical protein PFL1_04867 [Pseudozyma flocculosa PF-1]SPO39131.1 related to DUF431 domain protein [Pseudozyma flocculosa]